MSKIKNRIIVIVIIILVLMTGRIILLKYALSEWDNGIKSQGEEMLISSIGDKFIVQYKHDISQT